MLRIPVSSIARGRRSLWTTATLTSTCARSLIASIPPSSAPLALYTVSKHFPQDLVPSLRAALTSDAETSHAIGCLAEVAPGPSDPPFTLSLAHWTPSTKTETVVPFSTTLTGRPNVSLGREHKPRAGGRATPAELEFENRQFEKFLNGDKNWAFGDQLAPASTRGEPSRTGGGVEIPELSHVNPTHVREIVCFTADRIQPFLSALSQFPNSRTLGMTSTSTPFHSPQNLPFSLFYNDQVSSAGAVGVAVVDSDASSKTSVEINYGNLTRFGPVTTVTASRGNILLTLSSQNAAQLLLSSVQSLPASNEFTGESYDSSSPFEASLSNPNERSTKHISKDKEFYAALFSPPIGGAPDDTDLADLGNAKLVCRIMAGDPKRGAVSFETEEEVEVGDRVVFLHRPSPSSSTSSYSTRNGDQDDAIFSFKTIEPSYVSPIVTSTSRSNLNASGQQQQQQQQREPEEIVEVVVERKRGFFSFTENGIIVSRQRRRSGTGAVGNEDGDTTTYAEVRLAAIEGTTVSLVSS